jgi:DNA-binding CsgD family transcriptional regulator
VENLQGNLFRKLRVHNRAAALAAAHDLGLLDE